MRIDGCDSTGPSLANRVAIADGASDVAFTKPDRVRANHSEPSATASSTSAIETVLAVSPGAKPSAPAAAVKSAPDCAVPPSVAKFMLTVPVEGRSRVTTNCAVRSASSTTTSPTLTLGVPEGASLSMIVPRANALPITALTGVPSDRKKSSVPSAVPSARIATRTVLRVSPGAKFSVPSVYV